MGRSVPRNIEETREIPLTRGLVALVDAADHEWLSQWKWCADGYGYAIREERGERIRMHRLLLPGVETVDHINRNRADNRRSNLRPCNRQEHARNTSKHRRRRAPSSRFKGVCFRKDTGKWTAYINVDRGERQYLGCFATEEAAAAAYDTAALRAFGAFAATNAELAHG